MAGGTTPNRSLPILPDIPTAQTDWVRLRNFLVAIKAQVEGTAQNPDPPDQVTNLTVTLGAGGFTIAWNPSNRSTSYNIFRAVDSAKIKDSVCIGVIPRSTNPQFYDAVGTTASATKRTYWVLPVNGLVAGAISTSVSTTDVVPSGSGDFVGPASSTAGDVVVFDGITGKLGKDTSLLASSLVVGPASSAAGDVAVFDGITGKLLKDTSLVASKLVVGPTSVTDGHLTVFDGTTGKLVKDGGPVSSGTNTGDVTLVAGSGAPDYLTISGQAITQDQIDLTADVTGRLPLAHIPAAGSSTLLGHANDGTGGDYTPVTLGSGLSMSAGAVLSATGSVPASPSDATEFLNGAATPAFAQVKDSDLSTSDITTNNVTTAKHGFAPKAPNDVTKFLNGAGAYSVPPGTGSTSLIAEILLGSDSPTVSFTSIPGSFRHLRLVLQARLTETVTDDGIHVRFNNDSTAIYDWQQAFFVAGTSSNSGNYGQTKGRIGELPGASSSSSAQPGSVDMTIQNYARTDFNKCATCLGGYVAGTSGNNIGVISTFVHWRSTAAITQIDVIPPANNFKAGSIFSLYGLS